jgi:hypothetical protein
MPEMKIIAIHGQGMIGQAVIQMVMVKTIVSHDISRWSGYPGGLTVQLMQPVECVKDWER